MALKERIKVKVPPIDEMMKEINRNFIEKGRDVGAREAPRHYVIGVTCFEDENTRFLVCDSREEDIEDNRLPFYYGSTILEAVTKCYLDPKNHE